MIEPTDEVTGSIFDLDSLIPKELKDAMDSTQEPVTQKADKTTTPEETTVQDDSEEETSNEQLDKILGITKEKEDTEDEETEKPFWTKFEEYEEFKNDLEQLGYSAASIDKILEKAVNTQSGYNSEIVKNLNAQIDSKKEELEQGRLSTERSSKIEKNLYFDRSDYAQSNFLVPGQQLRQGIYETLKMEGAEDAFMDVLRSETKADMLRVLNDFEIDQKDLTKIGDSWKQFKTLNMSYIAERKKAEEDLGQALQTKLPEAVRVDVLREAIDRFSKQEEYADLKKAIDSQDKEYLNDIVGTARANLDSILQAIEDPAKAVTNKAWIQDLTGVLLDAAHKTVAFDEFKRTKQEFSTLQGNFDILKKEFIKLRNINKGPTKNGRSMFSEDMPTVTPSKPSKNGSGGTSDLDIAKKILSGDRDFIDELLFGKE